MEVNKKILIIDDQQEILDSLESIFTGKDSLKEVTAKFDTIMEEFFGEEVSSVSKIEEIYNVEVATRGEIGYEKVKTALEEGKPYSVVTIDMRMPGWDGLKTATEIRKIDKDIEIVIVTAYTDKNRDEIIKTVGTPEKLLYLKKPFDREEIMQLILSLTLKWSLEKEVKDQIKVITENKNRLEDIIYCVNKIEKIEPPDLIKTLDEVLNQMLVLLESKDGYIKMYGNQENYELGMDLDSDIKERLEKKVETQRKAFMEGDLFVIPFVTNNKLISWSVIKVLNNEIINKKNEKWLEIFVSNTTNLIRNSFLYKELEDVNIELSNQNQELLRINNLYRKFMVISSHELRTPATLISGYTNILKEKLYKNPEEEQKIYTGLIKSSERLNKLVSRILESFSLSNKGEDIILKKNYYKIEEIFDEIYTKVEMFLQKRSQKLILEKSENLPRLYVDKIKLVDFVLFNIVINAIKSSDDGKTIKIKAEYDKNRKKALISVIDEGIGIDKNEIEDIYSPFYIIGNEKYHHTGLYEFRAAGIGLGLTVVKDMLALFEEEIECESEKGVGTTFRFTLAVEEK